MSTHIPLMCSREINLCWYWIRHRRYWSRWKGQQWISCLITLRIRMPRLRCEFCCCSVSFFGKVILWKCFFRLKDGHRLVMDDRYDLNVLYKQHKVIFNMKDVHVDDTANYTLIANNGMENRTRIVQVFVKGEWFIFVTLSLRTKIISLKKISPQKN